MSFEYITFTFVVIYINDTLNIKYTAEKHFSEKRTNGYFCLLSQSERKFIYRPKFETTTEVRYAFVQIHTKKENKQSTVAI